MKLKVNKSNIVFNPKFNIYSTFLSTKYKHIFPQRVGSHFPFLDYTKVLKMAVKPVGSCSPGLTKVGLFLMALCIAAYILGPPLYWHFMEGLPAFSSSSLSTCPPCFCDCSSLTDFAFTEGWFCLFLKLNTDMIMPMFPSDLNDQVRLDPVCFRLIGSEFLDLVSYSFCL